MKHLFGEITVEDNRDKAAICYVCGYKVSFASYVDVEKIRVALEKQDNLPWCHGGPKA